MKNLHFALIRCASGAASGHEDLVRAWSRQAKLIHEVTGSKKKRGTLLGSELADAFLEGPHARHRVFPFLVSVERRPDYRLGPAPVCGATSTQGDLVRREPFRAPRKTALVAQIGYLNCISAILDPNPMLTQGEDRISVNPPAGSILYFSSPNSRLKHSALSAYDDSRG